ncbi:hypothetical protein [Cohnella zeiphila]|uniref:Uncharacterized protein n=1 Tax=Cohnella zeiphila TaxID=2761120 RepID=A0A7X0VYL2_9BACL|nr:hypothetical protein [Cohnella zeiphila]MBB6735474.1 hypothetical protein [Cohnella zeiphila]
MDPTDKELKEQLASGPFARDGFDDRLRRRIEMNLDRPEQRRSGSRRRRSRAAGALAAAAVLALIFAVWQWGPAGLGGHAGERASKLNNLQSATVPGLTEAYDETIRSAVLIGLRKDVTAPDGRTVSSYRTVLVAPQNNKLEVAAEGSGIVMPYKQTFWKIETTADDGHSDSQSLIAYQAYGSKALTEKPASVVATPRPNLVSERLLFVGNEYVAVAQDAAGGGDGAAPEYLYVKNIKQLASSAGTDYDPSTEPHTAFEDAVAEQPGSSTAAKAEDAAAVGASADGGKTEQWSIARKTGRWTGVSYGADSVTAPVDLNAEREIPTELPERVAPNDSLQWTWDQIRQVEPTATDAFSYNDLLATVVDREIKVYAYKQKDGLSHPLPIELEPNESIIMVLWALNQSESKNYADQWKKKVAEILDYKPQALPSAKS